MSITTTQELALAVADALENEDTWTSRAWARAEDGTAVHSWADNAVRWCAVSWARKLCPEGYLAIVPELREDFSRQYGKSMDVVNDVDGRLVVQAMLRALYD